MKVQNTKASAMSKRTLTLVLAMAVFLLSALILRVSLTNGFSVDVKTVNFVTDESVNMGGTLWVPSNATARQHRRKDTRRHITAVRITANDRKLPGNTGRIQQQGHTRKSTGPQFHDRDRTDDGAKLPCIAYRIA